ncbi:MAG TPA: hypothetical protein VLH35_05135 [Candidatus Acidoferrales bacterium]|nr:hypothetical protein [Candidatus Acidoferrales bacterium]
MSSAKSVWQGFVAASSLICLVITLLWLPHYLGLWATLACFILLAAPFALNCLKTIDRSIQQNSNAQATVKTAKATLMALQGLGFACWFFDVISTIFIIDIQQVAIELNFLGWPLSALGALLFYVPMVLVAYYLLFKVKSKLSFYVAVMISVLVLFMGALNINASLYNFNQIYPYSTVTDTLVVAIWVGVLLGLMALNFIAIKPKKTM